MTPKPAIPPKARVMWELLTTARRQILPVGSGGPDLRVQTMKGSFRRQEEIRTWRYGDVRWGARNGLANPGQTKHWSLTSPISGITCTSHSLGGQLSSLCHSHSLEEFRGPAASLLWPWIEANGTGTVQTFWDLKNWTRLCPGSAGLGKGQRTYRNLKQQKVHIRSMWGRPTWISQPWSKWEVLVLT